MELCVVLCGRSSSFLTVKRENSQVFQWDSWNELIYWDVCFGRVLFRCPNAVLYWDIYVGEWHRPRYDINYITETKQMTTCVCSMWHSTFKMLVTISLKCWQICKIWCKFRTKPEPVLPPNIYIIHHGSDRYEWQHCHCKTAHIHSCHGCCCCRIVIREVSFFTLSPSVKWE